MRSRIPEAEISHDETRVVGVTYLVRVRQVEGYRSVLHYGVAQISRRVFDVASFRRSRKLVMIAVLPERPTYSNESTIN